MNIQNTRSMAPININYINLFRNIIKLPFQRRGQSMDGGKSWTENDMSYILAEK